MSSTLDLKGSKAIINAYKVGKPVHFGFASFHEGVLNPPTQARTRQARQDWRVTDGMKVQSYSYSINTLRINFDSTTLEIIADGSAVNWRLQGLLPCLTESCNNPCLLVHTEYENKQEIFDRDTVLKQIVGLQVRYAPSATGLYLIWKPSHEIGLYAVPLVDQTGWLLHYADEKEKS